MRTVAVVETWRQFVDVIYVSNSRNASIENLRHHLFDENQFDLLSQHVKTIGVKMDEVSAALAAVDENVKDIWQASK
jgi:hypothetical protein